MSNYQRIISYIYEYEGGNKGRNVGFAKLETRGGQCRVTISIKKIYAGGNPMGVYLLSGQGEVPVGTAFVRNGSCEFRGVLNSANAEGSGIAMSQCYGLSVHEAENAWRAYTTIWEDAVAHAAEVELAEIAELEQAEESAREQRVAAAELGGSRVSRGAETAPAAYESAAPDLPGSGSRPGKEEDMAGAGIGEDSPDLPISREIEEQLEMEEAARLAAGADEGGAADAAPPSPEILAPGTASPEITAPGTASPETTMPGTASPEIPMPGPASPEVTPPKPPIPETEPKSPLAPETGPDTPPAPEMAPPASAGSGDDSRLLSGSRLPGVRTAETPMDTDEGVLRDAASGDAPVHPENIPADAAAPARRPLSDGAVLRRLEEEEKNQFTHQSVWERLRKKCPKIQAFDYENPCEVLTIKPQDIGLLPRETWIFGNNSFLLHGYYNYRYLILARLENPRGGRPRYLLGVPGHYYSNEKYMATMFGFANFVLSKNQPPKDGRFGYWYTDVKVGD